MGHTHGTKWTSELIESEIKNVMKSLNINRMPSSHEIKIVTHNQGLINKISKTGGFYKWAQDLHLQIKGSETFTGKKYEKALMKNLEIQGWKVERMAVRYPYDLLVNENIKIDVKASKRYYYDGKNYFYTFNLEKRNPTCDIYICYCINDEDLTEKILIIPSLFIHFTQLSIGRKSKYDKYIDRWDFLKQYDYFYKNLAQ